MRCIQLGEASGNTLLQTAALTLMTWESVAMGLAVEVVAEVHFYCTIYTIYKCMYYAHNMLCIIYIIYMYVDTMSADAYAECGLGAWSEEGRQHILSTIKTLVPRLPLQRLLMLCEQNVFGAGATDEHHEALDSLPHALAWALIAGSRTSPPKKKSTPFVSEQVSPL